MERLTEKDEYGNYDIADVESNTLYEGLGYDEFNKVTETLNKLGKLEDLQEQIGMPLLELFNEILGKDICYINDDEVDVCRAMGIRFVTTNDTIFSFTSVIPNHYDYVIITDSCWTFGLRDYRELWFLDKEEVGGNED